MRSGLISSPKSPPVSAAATQLGVYGRPKGSLHPQTLDWLAALGATPAQVYIDATDYFNREMDALGILGNYVMVNLYAGDDKEQAMVCNIAVLGDRTLTEFGGTGLVYGADYGFKADGTTVFLTGFKPEEIGATGGISTWMTVSVTGSLFFDSIGARDLSNTQTYIMNFYPDGPNWFGYWGENNFSTVSEALTAGLYTVRRASSTDLKNFKNGVEKASLTTSTTPGNSLSEFAVSGRNRQGLLSAELPSPNKIGGFCVEDGLIPDAKRASEAAVWATTMSMLGRN